MGPFGKLGAHGRGGFEVRDYSERLELCLLIGFMRPHTYRYKHVFVEVYVCVYVDGGDVKL